MSAKLKKLLKELQTARCPEDIFGELEANKTESLHQKYLEWAKNTHSDLCAPSEKHLAEEAFKLLGSFVEIAKKKIADNTYGNKNLLPKEITIKTKRGEQYLLKESLYSGDLCDLFKGEKDKKSVLIKICRSPANNDLIKNEADKLIWLWSESLSKDLGVMRHIIKPLDSFSIQEEKLNKQVNILELNEGFYSLEDVIKEYPEGIDSRDMAWMFNRLMGALLAAHQSKLIHGAVLPCHFLINPITHNGILIDWSYSLKKGEKIKAIVSTYKSFYPQEVFEKQPVNTGLDLYMTAKCMINLLEGERKGLTKPVPKPIMGLLKACLLSPTKRTNDIWELHTDFEQILNALYGKRKFRHFEMPRNTKVT